MVFSSVPKSKQAKGPEVLGLRTTASRPQRAAQKRLRPALTCLREALGIGVLLNVP